MKIAITADPELPVPPKYYGGIERIIDMVVTGLVERGPAVALIANRESRSPGRLDPWPGRKHSSQWDTTRTDGKHLS